MGADSLAKSQVKNDSCTRLLKQNSHNISTQLKKVSTYVQNINNTCTISSHIKKNKNHHYKNKKPKKIDTNKPKSNVKQGLIKRKIGTIK